MVWTTQRAIARLLCATAVIAASTAPPLSAQVVRGLILDATTRNPVASVRVQLLDEAATVCDTAMTDVSGQFTLQAPRAGGYAVRVDAVGYTSFVSELLSLAAEQTRTVEIHLPSLVTQLEPVMVIGEREPHSIGLQRFEEHRERGFGHFLTREEIEARAPIVFTDLMWGIPGVSVERWNGFVLPVNAPPRRGGSWYYTIRMRGHDVCPPILYVDGMLMGDVDFVSDEGIDDLVWASDLDAVEVYRGPSEVPPDYSSAMSACGVIAVWTRRDRSENQRTDKLLSVGLGLTVPLDRVVLQVVSRAGPWDRYPFTMRFRVGVYEGSGTLSPDTTTLYLLGFDPDRSEYISAYFGVQGPPLLLPWKLTSYMRIAGGATLYGPQYIDQHSALHTGARFGMGTELALGFRLPHGSVRPWLELGMTTEYVLGAGWDVAGLLLLAGVEFGELLSERERLAERAPSTP